MILARFSGCRGVSTSQLIPTAEYFYFKFPLFIFLKPEITGANLFLFNRNKFARWEKKRVCPMLSSIFCRLKTHTQEKKSYPEITKKVHKYFFML
ncbi:MAG: hypothetical protein A2096_00165 [Spirochaetes bacterium GWF1_41_5]|nr:MAG: hypothetical protein A2096_00165 [Spirochaetes bacterium GWF1_41_5]